ncbi:polysaccharide pyruvyl transferase family protein [Mycetocola zhujimingii]|uniref:Polysaccharide pyruvyl transferase family protein n=1 Tax=Mycetocola zhujimingii TaxID=2079792 RepID=A0A2U1TEW6_9MICO|nr:polysaccharide pyruvyl transferase family protein [Mycetocola zhujimingii]PWC07424.1 polysaccharide pyruvyl transferase family protein [Mycetocola zhujimingii]
MSDTLIPGWRSPAATRWASLGKRIRGWKENKRQREQIYLVAPAGIPNFGDEFIARGWLNFLASQRPHADVWLDCPEPGRAASMLRDTHPRLRTTNTLWQMAYQSTSDNAEGIGEDARRLTRELGSPKVDIGLSQLRSMSTIHFLGGGYLNDVWKQNIGIVASAHEAKKLTGLRVYATGQGFLPQSDDSAAYLKRLISDFDFVESRDDAGASVLGITHGLDDAFLGLAVNPRQVMNEANLPEIMILIQSDFLEGSDEAHVTDVIRDFIRSRQDEGLQGIGFVEAMPPHDRHFYDILRDEFPDARYFSFQDIWERGLPAGANQTWLTSRFHFHLLAAAAGAKGTWLSLAPGYYDVKHGSLATLGTGWSQGSVAPGGEAPAPAASEAFSDVARRSALTKLALARRLYP